MVNTVAIAEIQLHLAHCTLHYNPRKAVVKTVEVQLRLIGLAEEKEAHRECRNPKKAVVRTAEVLVYLVGLTEEREASGEYAETVAVLGAVASVKVYLSAHCI